MANEAAKTDTRTDLAGRLEALVRRFHYMAEVREKEARKQRTEGRSYSGIAGLENAAEAYRRCGRELERAAAGEAPAAPGENWPQAPNA